MSPLDAARETAGPRQLIFDHPFQPAPAREDFKVAERNELAVGGIDRRNGAMSPPDAARDTAGPRQITFDLPFRTVLARENFEVAECNELAVGWIDRWSDWPGSGLILHGPEGCGKSHLAAVWRAASGAAELRGGALDLEAGRDLAERGGALLLEDIDKRLAAEPVWQETLLHLYNALRAAGGSLLMTARSVPGAWRIGLPDLRSRIAALPAAAITLPDDRLLEAVLRKQFGDRQLAVKPELMRYILPRIERSFPAIRSFVDRIDRLALERQRRIGKDLAAEALNWRTRSYQEAGVDIAAGDRLVARIAPLAEATARPGTMGGIGGFGGLFDLAGAGYRDPILVAATDGVGTKLRIAIATGRHRTIGIDLVAMCVNDLVVSGAEPLFFLDYFGAGKLEPEVAAEVVSGIAAGCRDAGCALIGGETAELPGLYAGGDYDLAGFAVGAVERGRLLTGASAAPGDIVLGLASDGLHANGFSLVRMLCAEAGLRWDDPAPFEPARPLGEALLTPTRIYVHSCLAAARSGGVKALAHITGGGLTGNIPRVLPAGMGVDLDSGAWTVPPVFGWLQETGQLDPAEMARTFNCGLGMIAITAPDAVDEVEAILRGHGETVTQVGTVVKREAGAPAVHIMGWEDQWRA